MPDLLAPYASASALEAYRALGAPVGAGERSGPGGSIGLLHFAGLGATEAAILLERLPPGDLLDGQNFSPISGPGPATSHFTGLQAFGTNHVLATDTLSRVYRFHGTRTADGGTTADLWLDLTPLTAGSPMRALKATSPDDVWVVGDNNNVLHFGD